MEKTILEHINKLNKILRGEISYLNFSWTNVKSILCQIGLNGFNIYIEIFLDDNKNEIETVINVYRDKECYLAYGGKMEECLEKINEMKK